MVDDRPFGGGPGMILKVEPVVECVEAVRASDPDPGHLVMLTPQGRRLDAAGRRGVGRPQTAAAALRTVRRVSTIACGRFSSRMNCRSAISSSAAAKWRRWW